jgi:hypothetical protein
VLNWGFAPGALRLYRAATPSCLARFSHWLMAPGVTPRAAAIATWLQPAWLSSQARSRRPSLQSVASCDRFSSMLPIIHQGQPDLKIIVESVGWWPLTPGEALTDSLLRVYPVRSDSTSCLVRIPTDENIRPAQDTLDKIIRCTGRCDLSLFQLGLRLRDHLLNQAGPIPHET